MHQMTSFLSKPNLWKKVMYLFSCFESLHFIVDNISFFGAIESPFEDRIVVITSFEVYDYQGDAGGTALAIAGCKLNTGFK